MKPGNLRVELLHGSFCLEEQTVEPAATKVLCSLHPPSAAQVGPVSPFKISWHPKKTISLNHHRSLSINQSINHCPVFAPESNLHIERGLSTTALKAQLLSGVQSSAPSMYRPAAKTSPIKPIGRMVSHIMSEIRPNGSEWIEKLQQLTAANAIAKRR